MDQSEANDTAYAQGRHDAAQSGPSTGGAGQVLLAMATGVTANQTSLKQVYYNPPEDPEAKLSYDRGWKDHFGES
jgi:hypothetical protein